MIYREPVDYSFLIFAAWSTKQEYYPVTVQEQFCGGSTTLASLMDATTRL